MRQKQILRSLLVVVVPLLTGAAATPWPFADEVEEIAPWTSFDEANLAKRAMSPAPRCNGDVKLAVVTRSGFRPQCLANLQASLAAQVGVTFVQVISNDAGRDGRKSILEQTKRRGNLGDVKVVDVDRYLFNKGLKNKCYTTKYLEGLYAQVPPDSWIITLDDDARLARTPASKKNHPRTTRIVSSSILEDVQGNKWHFPVTFPSLVRFFFERFL
mmetsp:Transcript_13081/g.42640  ORF Transcript_13081/g.42640 Transcript_13081/m.42640 type:complete len:215 (-) Transcript_13081:605-1249(-)